MIWGRTSLTLVTLLCLFACGTTQVETGGETNWLSCEQDDDCPDGEACSHAKCVTPESEASTSEPSESQFERAKIETSAPTGLDTSGGALRVIEVPTAGGPPRLINTPLGWLALSSRSLGDPRAPSGYENALYRSTNGVDWEALALDELGDDLHLSALAYGNGTYVILGTRLGANSLVLFSSNAETWTEVPQPASGSGLGWGRLVFAGEYFFAMGFATVGASHDGEHWTTATLDLPQPITVAYGNGRYVMTGSGPMAVSDDGLSWTSVELDCQLPGACITDPSGGVIQSIEYDLVFAEGRFRTDQLSSEDGLKWRAEPDVYPVAFVGGHLLGNLRSEPWSVPAWLTSGASSLLRAVRPSRASVTAAGRALNAIGELAYEVELPASVSVGFDDGLNCDSTPCLLLGNRLLLVPPPDASPLPDNVPRDANNVPLLSDECPVSSMLFCDDYEQRRGCICEPTAPQGPDYCADVSHYRCEGQFIGAPNEWKLDEIREAGCDCGGTDPNQPATFGLTCSSDENPCEAPFKCLSIDTQASFGPPGPRRLVCTTACTRDADCPSWEATGFCAGEVSLRCSNGSCQPRQCQ